ncbi:MAG: MCE family protein, partial [Geodermatophilales bacterium]|nr:MCE family protein [Geodermatophilales bacterium]
MITRSTKIKLLAFAAVAVLGMAYLGFKYVGLDRTLLGSGYDVAADFRDSGGIFVNAEVTYRGVAVGRVSDMSLIDKGVRV